MTPIPIPPRLADRPLYRGLVIPYGTMILSNGDPDFTTNDEARRMEVMRDRKCAICGKPLDYWIYFIGGDKSYASRMFLDPAMHEECARYSMAVCPYLRNEKAQHKTHTKSMDDVGLVVEANKLMSMQRPAKMGLFLTRSYQIANLQGSLVCFAAPRKSAEWF